MRISEVIDILKEREIDYLKTKSFSQQPGIYALFYIGEDFPLLGDQVSKHEIIYIGKTESSQEKRDAKTHFTTDKTGSSTVRKSIGAILCSDEKLIPIPRNDTDYEKGRFSHFKFDKKSEEKITGWMKQNLALSFYEYQKSKQEIEDLETEIIKNLVPILNISKNPQNPFRSTLKQLRKNCALMARKVDLGKSENTLQKTNVKPTLLPKNMSSSEGTIYIDNITDSDVSARKIRIKVANKHLFPTERTGVPQTYELRFRVNDYDFQATYTIGSKDGKSRSGVLKLGDKIFQEILKIRPSSELKISKLMTELYTIEKK